MSNNIRIAKELVRLAKSLVAEEVADKEGEYKDFTGKISWGNTQGSVQDATFELSSGGDPIIWKEGRWEDGTWAKGTWENGAWVKGTWKDGTWKGGTWFGGTWKGGDWEDGFDGRRKNHPAGDSPDNWEK